MDTIVDYWKEQYEAAMSVIKDNARLVREIDVILNGEEGAAKQASLCDLVGQIKKLKKKAEEC